MSNKKFGIIAIAVLTTGLLTGCSADNKAFYFDFSKLLQVENNIEKEVPLEGLNLKQAIVTKDEILKIKENVNEVFKVLANKDYYFNNFNNNSKYFSSVKNYLSNDFYTKLSTGEVKSSLKKSIDNIYYNEYSLFKEANVISVEKTIDGLNCKVEVVSLTDDILFNIEVIELALDNNFNIIGDKTISEMTSEANTTKALGEDSLLQDNHNEFVEKLETLFADLKNPNLYEELMLEDASKAEFSLETMINNIKMKNKDNDILKQLFIAGKGTFSTYAIDSYRIDDIDSMANTTYVLKFSVNGEIQNFEVEYNRILKDITKVTKRA